MTGSRVSFRLEGETRRFGRIVRTGPLKTFVVSTPSGRETVPARLISFEEN